MYTYIYIQDILQYDKLYAYGNIYMYVVYAMFDTHMMYLYLLYYILYANIYCIYAYMCICVVCVCVCVLCYYLLCATTFCLLLNQSKIYVIPKSIT